MTRDDEIQAFWLKAEENLAAAESDIENHRYNTGVSRCYYACFLAGIAVLLQAGIRPLNQTDRWEHDFVQSRFAGQLISRRKRYPARLAEVLPRLIALRHTADYDTDFLSSVQAERALRRAHDFLAMLQI